MASDPSTTVDLLVLCTGNAARSVMAGYMLDFLAEADGVGLRVVTAGTHVLDGQPMGMRTRNALATIDVLGELPVARHRSHQVVDADFAQADLVVAMEADHVRYVRRRHPDAAARTATLRRLCRALPLGPPGLAHRVAALDLASLDLDADEDVADPAGRDGAVYAACAREIWELCVSLVERL
jgi:protein-tyrosine-phosphatase